MLPSGAYEPLKYEEEILKNWIESKFYKPEYDPRKDRVKTTEEMKKDDRPPFCIICPPPNAYDRPHIGNLSGYAYQDAMGRYERMRGKKVLLFPGKDHAGIDGEAVFVREELDTKGIDKFSIDRKEFYKQVWDWQMNKKEAILKDEKIIGLSADFDRDLFTLDPKVVNIVLSTFVDMFKKDIIYKGVRIINWDPKARSPISDSQCERKEREGILYTLRYPIINQHVWKLNFYKNEILNRIKDGTKTVETRALNPEEPERYFGNIKAGDLIICKDKQDNSNPSIYKKVKKFEIYTNFEEVYKNVNNTEVFTKKYTSVDELKNEYNKLAIGYGDKIEKNGLIAIYLEELSPEDYIYIATTRPETMFGDTAIAVNPEDEKYHSLLGKKVILPILDKEIPIISDPKVEKEFGTGALKITPAHAIDDYEIMLNWNFKNKDKQIGYVNVINKDLKLCGPVPGKYLDMKYNVAKSIIVEDMKEQGILIKEEKIIQNILISERTGAIIEPLISSQWFMSVETLRNPVINMVRNGETIIHPKSMENKFYHWMENLRDWAISRSLWWGYQLPVWYAGSIEEKIDDNGQIKDYINIDGKSKVLDYDNPEHIKVQIEPPTNAKWIQDDNVLDTWFSSGQWSYATLMVEGLMDTFYPSNVMETMYDILTKWVVNMMILSQFKTEKAPFKHVYLHGMVLAADGQKMSKSKRNAIPFDDLHNQYGIDALRMCYFYQNKAGGSYSLSHDKMKNFRNFNNKIWNASKFVLMNLEDIDKEEWFDSISLCKNIDQFNELIIQKQYKKHFQEEDITMVERIYYIERKYHICLEKFRYGIITEELYNEFWHTFCDVYIEKAKTKIKPKEGEVDKEAKKSSQIVLYYSLRSFLKMLHPFIPYITEKVWQEVPKSRNDHRSLMYTMWD